MILDALVKNTSNWQSEMAIMRDKMEKYEKVIKMLVEKLGIEVETILR